VTLAKHVMLDEPRYNGAAFIRVASSVLYHTKERTPERLVIGSCARYVHVYKPASKDFANGGARCT